MKTIVCMNVLISYVQTRTAYAIAEAGLGLRDEQPFRFGGFHNIINPKSLVLKPAKVRAGVQRVG